MTSQIVAYTNTVISFGGIQRAVGETKHATYRCQMGIDS